MPRTIEVQIYKYSELTGRAKDKAKDWCIEASDCSEELNHLFVSALHDAGYPTLDINYSLSYCQGDGVSFFTGGKIPSFEKGARLDYTWINLGSIYASGSVDLKRLWLRRLSKHQSTPLKRELYRLYTKYVATGLVSINVEISRRGSSMHSHYNSMDVMLNVEWHDQISDEEQQAIDYMANRIERHIADDVKEMSKQLAKDGYAAIEYQRSDEVINETMEANDYEFTAAGKPA